MFTGIVQAEGRVMQLAPRPQAVRLVVDAQRLDVSDVAVGDSIAVNGCCLTVVEREGAILQFDVSDETLRCTARVAVGDAVNLEKALRLADRLGGHLMLGHVDGVGRVAAFEPAGTDAQGSYMLAIDAPAELAPFIATKGSIAVQGVSLTVNRVEGRRFAVNLIPHTLAVTNLRLLQAGIGVNLEIDVVARYVARLQEAGDAR